MANIELPAPADRTIHLTGTIDETASENFIRKVDEIDAYDITMATNTLIHVNSLGFDATAYTQAEAPYPRNCSRRYTRPRKTSTSRLRKP